MKRILMSLTMLAAISSLFVMQAVAFSTAADANAAAAAGTASFPVNFTSGTKTLAGNFNVTRFIVQDGVLKATGNLVGTITDTATGTVTNVNQALTLPVLMGSTTGTCEILHLELGPLDLNLLGLVVHLDRVVLDISAQSGSGNLLGNLLCAVAKLLDKGGPLDGIAGLLNNILRNL